MHRSCRTAHCRSVSTSPTCSGDPARRATVTVAAPLADLGNGVASSPGRHAGRASTCSLERIADGIVVRGERGRAVAGGLQPLPRSRSPGEIAVHVDELFEPAPLEGETYPLDDDALDLDRSSATRSCSSSRSRRCAPTTAPGSARAAAPTATTTRATADLDDTDPRWAALRSLEL